MLQSSSLIMRSLSQMSDNIVANIKTNMKKILFHYRKWYEYIIQPLG
jgi:hypothetical protein